VRARPARLLFSPAGPVCGQANGAARRAGRCRPEPSRNGPVSLAAQDADHSIITRGPACLPAAGGTDPKPKSHAVHFCLRLREDVDMLEMVKRFKGEGPAASAAGSGEPLRAEDAMDHNAQVCGSGGRSGRDWSIPGHNISPEVCSALGVVQLLHQKLGAGRGDKRRWQSQWLTKRLMCQLRDALAFASCWLPQWCLRIPRFMPFLFSLEARQRLLDCNGFGSSYALYRFQEHKVAAYRIKHAESMRQTQQQLARAREQQDIDAISRATDDLDIIEQRMYRRSRHH
jgi:hypothetical protein